MGYYLVFLVIVIIRLLKRSGLVEQRILTFFLAGMPLIYIGNWLRFDGDSMWIFAELVGLLIFGGLAFLSKQRLLLLPIGIAGLGFWDLLHLTHQEFVPDWYIAACAVIDVCCGFYAFARFRVLVWERSKYNT